MSIFYQIGRIWQPVYFSTPAGNMRTFLVYWQFSWIWYNKSIRKQDWGGR